MCICASDGESRLDSSEVPKLEDVGVVSRRRRDYRDPYHQLSSQRSTVQDGQHSLHFWIHIYPLVVDSIRDLTVEEQFLSVHLYC